MMQPDGLLKGYWYGPHRSVPFKKPDHHAYDAILLADRERFPSFCVTALAYRGEDDVWSVNYEGSAYGSNMLSGIMNGEPWHFVTWAADPLKPYRVFKALAISRLRTTAAAETYSVPVVVKDLRNLSAAQFVVQLSLIEVAPASVCQAGIVEIRADLQDRIATMLYDRGDAACLDCGCFATAARLVREFRFDD